MYRSLIQRGAGDARHNGIVVRFSAPAMLVVAIAATIGFGREAAARSQPLAPRINELLRQSALVVVGNIERVSEHDDGRLRQADLRVNRVIKGAIETTVAKIIEERRFPSVPPTLRPSGRTLAFLAPASMTSQLRRALPSGQYYHLLEEPWGLIVLPDAPSEKVAAELVDGWLGVQRGDQSDATALAREERRLVFLGLGARPERLVEDGIGGLHTIPQLAPTLTDDERNVIGGALRRTDLAERIRVALVEAIADARLQLLAPVLRDLPGAGPKLLRASAVARARLGDAPGKAELEAALENEDAGVRAAAVHAAAVDPKGSIATIGEVALNDPDRGARLSAIEVLGDTGAVEALPILGQTFADDDRNVRQKSAQAIFKIGGRPAAVLLTDLAFTAPPDGQRQAVALLMAMGISRNDPLLTRIRTSHPDEGVRDLATHGFKAHGH